jgi:hypothetical protein
MSSPLSVAPTQAKIDRLVVHLFEKDPPIAGPASVPVPVCIENPPPSVRITIFLSFLLPSLVNLFRLQTQGLYPKACIDVEVSSGKDVVLRPTTH